MSDGRAIMWSYSMQMEGTKDQESITLAIAPSREKVCYRLGRKQPKLLLIVPPMDNDLHRT